MADLCGKHGVIDASIYKREGQVRRMEGCLRSQASRMLEDENTKLERPLAEAMLDNAALKDLLGKK